MEVGVGAPKDATQAELGRGPAQLLQGQRHILEGQEHHAKQAIRGAGTVVGEPIIVGPAECRSTFRVQIFIPTEAEAGGAEEDGDIDALPVQVIEVGLAIEATGDGVAEGAPPGHIGDAGPNGSGATAGVSPPLIRP